MILSCERCDARYAIDTGQLGGSGRKVRCASCGHVWFQAPDQPAAHDRPAARQEAESAAPAAAPVPEASTGEAARPLRRFGAVQPPKEKPKGDPAWRRAVPRVAALALPTALLIAALAGFRAPLVEMWPPIARLYAALGAPSPETAPGLAIRAVHVENRQADGHRTVIVAGEVKNTASYPRRLPPLRARLTEGGKTMAHWSFSAGPQWLASGQSVRFTTRLADAPKGGRSVSVGLWR